MTRRYYARPVRRLPSWWWTLALFAVAVTLAAVTLVRDPLGATSRDCPTGIGYDAAAPARPVVVMWEHWERAALDQWGR